VVFPVPVQLLLSRSSHTSYVDFVLILVNKQNICTGTAHVSLFVLSLSKSLKPEVVVSVSISANLQKSYIGMERAKVLALILLLSLTSIKPKIFASLHVLFLLITSIQMELVTLFANLLLKSSKASTKLTAQQHVQ